MLWDKLSCVEIGNLLSAWFKPDLADVCSRYTWPFIWPADIAKYRKKTRHPAVVGTRVELIFYGVWGCWYCLCWCQKLFSSSVTVENPHPCRQQTGHLNVGRGSCASMTIHDLQIHELKLSSLQFEFLKHMYLEGWLKRVGMSNHPSQTIQSHAFAPLWTLPNKESKGRERERERERIGNFRRSEPKYDQTLIIPKIWVLLQEFKCRF